ncbi:MAG TPA: hypothetical protein VGX70_08695, partial [Gemmataceae bacterium]|nr:hypothetical protein [Gemmataceae bacterium]
MIFTVFENGKLKEKGFCLGARANSKTDIPAIRVGTISGGHYPWELQEEKEVGWTFLSVRMHSNFKTDRNVHPTPLFLSRSWVIGGWLLIFRF